MTEEADASPAVEVVDESISETPEADRLFDPPTEQEAAHALRDLGWEERFVCTRVGSARGNTETYLYSLEQAAVLLLDESSSGVSLGASGSFLWIDFDSFVRWIRTVVGDTAFADALAQKLAERDAFNDKIETLRQVMSLRMAQYAPYFPEDDSEENDR